MNASFNGVVHEACDDGTIACAVRMARQAGSDEPEGLVGEAIDEQVTCMACVALLGTATRVREVPWRGRAAVYVLSRSLDEYDYVVVSAVVASYGSGPETYVFGCDERGKTSSMSELSGSYRGGLDHGRALARAGYRIVEPETSSP